MNDNIVQGEVIDVNYRSTVGENKNAIKVKIYPYNNESSDTIIATPLSPNTNINPIKGEIVLLLKSLNAYSSFYRRFYNYYYFAKVNIHNNVNNNILKGASGVENISRSDLKLNNIENSIAGSTLRNMDFSVEFDEKFVPSIQQYPGDISHVGRFGNHIRLTRSKPEDNEYTKDVSWEAGGNNNDPLLTIVNGYGSYDPDVITENINEDKSSLYLASTQKLPLDLINKKFDSFDEEPDIQGYQSPQIILNSGRIVLNSKSDGIIASTEKYINLSTKEIHLNANDTTIIDSPEILLGSNNADEPLVLGNANEEWLKKLIDIIKKLQQIVSEHTHLSPVGPTGTPMPQDITRLESEVKLKLDLQKNNTELDKLKSEIGFTQKSH